MVRPENFLDKRWCLKVLPESNAYRGLWGMPLDKAIAFKNFVVMFGPSLGINPWLTVNILEQRLFEYMGEDCD